MTPQVDQFIRDFKSCAYWCKHLIWLNEQLEVLEHELTWGRHSSVDLTPEQLKSPLPMPTNTSRRLDAIDCSMSECMEMNIEKLKVRYPDGFDPERSLHRAEGDVAFYKSEVH